MSWYKEQTEKRRRDETEKGLRGKVQRLERQAGERNARLGKAEALLLDISNWLVCEAITTPEDMAQSFTPYREQIDLFLEGEK